MILVQSPNPAIGAPSRFLVAARHEPFRAAERRVSSRAAAILVASLAMVVGPGTRAAPVPAELVITDARIYTADSERSMAEALAVREGKLVFVGKAAEVAKLVGRSEEHTSEHQSPI